jgi:trehalose-phosphatase
MDLPTLLARASASPSLLVATDVDGTIADVELDPSRVHIRPDALAPLARLARAFGVHVAVISGRTMDSLRPLTRSLDPISRVAEHGAFLALADGSTLAAPLLVSPHILARVACSAESAASRVPGMRVERKLTSVAMHVRAVAAQHRAEALSTLSSFRACALAANMIVVDGREVVEARASRWSKADALAALLERLPNETFVVYAGDDTTDEGAIRLASRTHGAGIHVASEERPRANVKADLCVEGPAAWAAILEAIAEAREPLSRRGRASS